MIIKYGFANYKVLSESDLIKAGLVYNKNMWMPDGGWHFCPNCARYTFSKAYSTPGQSDCRMVCLDCMSNVEYIS